MLPYYNISKVRLSERFKILFLIDVFAEIASALNLNHFPRGKARLDCLLHSSVILQGVSLCRATDFLRL